MRYKISNVLWGIFWIAIGLGIAGNVLNLWHFNFFFDGWWTFLIIIPSIISVVQYGFGNSSTIWLIIGVFLLLASRGLIDMELVRKLMIPIILIVIGIHMVIKNLFITTKYKNIRNDNKVYTDYTATFSSRRVVLPPEVFTGAELNAIFGGIDLDCRDAVIQEDIIINVSAIFGGINIFVPDNVRVKSSSTSIFGGVSNKRYRNIKEGPIIYISGTCMFGGVEIK